MNKWKIIEIRELVEAGEMSSLAIKQYLCDQELQLQNKASVSAEKLMEKYEQFHKEMTPLL